METLIGAALVWFLGNKDLIKLLAAFCSGLGVVATSFTLWHRTREDDRYNDGHF